MTQTNHNNCYRCICHHQPNDCPARGKRCYYCNNIGLFSHLCKSRYTNSHRYNTRRPSHRRHSRRSSGRSSSRSSSRNRSHNRCTRRHRSPTPHPIDTLTITGPNAAPSNDTEKNSTQLKCKSRHPTPVPAKLFSFPTFSYTDPDDTASEISIEIHSQDEDESSTDYNTISPPRHYYIPMTPPRTMLPRPSTMLPRPSSIPIPEPGKTTKNQHNKNKPTTQKIKSSLKPSCIPIFNNKKQKPATQVTQLKVQQRSYSLPRPCEGNTREQPKQIHPEPTPVTKSHFYQHHQHTTDSQPAQDHQHPTTTGKPPFQDHHHSFQDHHQSTTSDFTSIHTFQDPTLQDSTTNDHHYSQAHHTSTKDSSQDHTNSLKDTTCSKYLYHHMFPL